MVVLATVLLAGFEAALVKELLVLAALGAAGRLEIGARGVGLAARVLAAAVEVVADKDLLGAAVVSFLDCSVDLASPLGTGFLAVRVDAVVGLMGTVDLADGAAGLAVELGTERGRDVGLEPTAGRAVVGFAAVVVVVTDREEATAEGFLAAVVEVVLVLEVALESGFLVVDVVVVVDLMGTSTVGTAEPVEVRRSLALSTTPDAASSTCVTTSTGSASSGFTSLSSDTT